MPRLSPTPISLTEVRKRKLRAIVRKHTSPRRSVIRAKIIWLAAENKGIHETARLLGIYRSMVRKWRKRWLGSPENMSVHDRLADAPRPGAPATYAPEQICPIMAIACERPEGSDRPVTHRTRQELADEAAERGVAEAISRRPAGRFSDEADPKPRHVRGWLTPKQEEGFREKCHDICGTYEKARKREKEKKKRYPLMK